MFVAAISGVWALALVGAGELVPETADYLYTSSGLALVLAILGIGLGAGWLRRRNGTTSRTDSSESLERDSSQTTDTQGESAAEPDGSHLAPVETRRRTERLDTANSRSLPTGDEPISDGVSPGATIVDTTEITPGPDLPAPTRNHGVPTHESETAHGADEESDESQVLALLSAHDGRMRQSEIVTETDWSKSKVSVLLSEMETAGTITRFRLGREKVVCLDGTEPDLLAFSSKSANEA